MLTTLLASYRKQFAYYRHLGEGALEQLTDEQAFRDDEAGSNSAAVIVKHLSGNMKSRWTNFLTEDGEKPWRRRDEEFVADFADRTALDEAWQTGWAVLEGALSELRPQDLGRIVYIRNEGHTVAEALNRQLAHYAYHVGQLVLLGKQLRGSDWRSLSIPKGASAAFNERKFAQQRGVRNFIDGLMVLGEEEGSPEQPG